MTQIPNCTPNWPALLEPLSIIAAQISSCNTQDTQEGMDWDKNWPWHVWPRPPWTISLTILTSAPLLQSPNRRTKIFMMTTSITKRAYTVSRLTFCLILMFRGETDLCMWCTSRNSAAPPRQSHLRWWKVLSRLRVGLCNPTNNNNSNPYQ